MFLFVMCRLQRAKEKEKPTDLKLMLQAINELAKLKIFVYKNILCLKCVGND